MAGPRARALRVMSEFIPHSSTCEKPRAEVYLDTVMWETEVGVMRRVLYMCPSCGESHEIEKFVPVVEPEDRSE